jgi:hypothetical protein
VRDHREVIEVERLIRDLGPADRPSKPATGVSVRSHPGARLHPVPMSAGWIRASVGLGVLLAVALPQWPYARDCGGWLILYLVAVGMVVIAGIWGARLTWNGRLGYAHIIALGTLVWGLTLTSQEVLTRVGYAKAQATWFCTP